MRLRSNSSDTSTTGSTNGNAGVTPAWPSTPGFDALSGRHRPSTTVELTRELQATSEWHTRHPRRKVRIERGNECTGTISPQHQRTTEANPIASCELCDAVERRPRTGMSKFCVSPTPTIWSPLGYNF